jgi:hypothetical protein
MRLVGELTNVSESLHKFEPKLILSAKDLRIGVARR